MTTKKAVLIAAGILGGLVLVVALVAGAILGFVFYSLDHSDAAQTAKTFLRENKKLKQEIGEVQDFGWFTTGNVGAQGGSGNAELHLKTVGARASVNTTVVLAFRNGHEWRVVDAFYDDAAGERVFLTKNFDDTGAISQTGEGAGENSDANEASDESGDDESFDEESFAANVLKAREPVLVALGSPSSLDSLELDKTLIDEIAPKYEERVSLVRYDVGEQPVLFQRFELKKIPTLLVFKNGAEVERREGKLSASDLSRLLDKYLDK